MSLAAACHERGLSTAGFSTDPYLNAYYGYDRGFDAFFELFDVTALWQHVCRDYIGHYARRFRDGAIDRAALQALVEPLLVRLLSYAADYYDRKLRAPERALCTMHSPLYAQDFVASAARIRSERAALERAPTAYVDTLLQMPDVTGAEQATGNASTRTRVDDAFMRVADALGAYSPKRYQPTVDAHDVVSLADAWIGAQGNAPFFAWLSLNDVHDLNFCHSWMSRATWRYRRRARKASDLSRLQADLSLQFVDDAIQRLLNALRRRGLLDSTLIVVCADHGRLDATSTSAGMFGDALIRVPLLFWHAGIEAAIDAHPCALLDVAPTMLELMGLGAEPAFRGVSLLSPKAAQRQHVIVEQLGGGPCDLARTDPTICLVGRTYKYAWAADGREWFNDLLERPRRGFVAPADDIARALLAPLREIARQRYAEIRAGAGLLPVEPSSVNDQHPAV